MDHGGKRTSSTWGPTCAYLGGAFDDVEYEVAPYCGALAVIKMDPPSKIETYQDVRLFFGLHCQWSVA